MEYKRYCKTLELRDDPELMEEYKKYHSPEMFWSEIGEGIREVGILDMELYLLGTRLFMIMDTVPDFDHDKAMEKLSGKPRQAEWEAFMAKFQKSSAEATADEKWQVMDRIFKLP
jgi:L-rhamnose mutarotase